MRARRKKINSVLRSNVNKKMIQLHRIIFELQSTNEHFKFQQEFISNFFNPRIDNAINAYREHISKMQKVALEDYDFIIDRTDRFYKKKYQNLINSNAEEINSLKIASIAAVDELEREKQDSLHILSQLRNQIIIFEQDSQKEIDNYLSEFKSSVEKTKEEGRIRFKTEISNLQAREQKFLSESEQKQKKMEEDHFLLMNLIKNGYVPPKLNLQTIKSKIKEIKKCINGHQSNLKTLQTYALKQISIKRNEINQIIKEIKLLIIKHKDEQNSIQKVIDSENAEFEGIIQQLKQQFDFIKQKYQTEIEQKQNELNSIKKQLQAEFENKKSGLSQNNIDDEMQISILKKSLNDDLQAILLSYEKERNSMNQKIEDLEKQIELFIVQSEQLVNQLKKQLADLIESHKIEIDDYASLFIKEKEEMIRKYRDELNATIEKFKMAENSDSEHELKLKAQIQELEKEKEEVIINCDQKLTEFNMKTADFLNSIENETSEKVSTLKSQIDSMLDGYSKMLEKKINDTLIDNERKKKELITSLANRHESEMSLIRDCGFSRDEHDKLQKKYQDEHGRLVEQLKHMVPFVITDDMFANMVLVISDLQKELQDHVTMVSSQRRCIEFEGQKSYDELSKKNASLQQKTQNSRARNQAIQSIKNQIARTIKNKEEKLIQLNNEFSQLFVKKKNQEKSAFNDDYEINKLNDTLNDVIRDSDESISSAIRLTEHKKKSLRDEFSSQIQILNEEIKNILKLTQRQNAIFENKMNELSNTSNLNKMCYNQSYEHSVNYYLNIFDNMKKNFLENEHLLRMKIKEQKYQNSRNYDIYKSNEMEEYKKLTKIYNEKEEQNNGYLVNRQKVKDDMKTKINELQNRKGIIVRKANETQPPSPEKETIEKLERHLKLVTNQLNLSLQDLIEYKNIYISQEKKINQNFNGNPEVGVFKKKQNCVNYDVI